MRFKLDENLPRRLVEVLTTAGHDAITAAEQQLGGAPDERLSAACQAEKRALITLDTDFADIRAYPPADYPGLVVLRLRRQDARRILSTLQRMVPLFEKERLSGALWIVEDHRVRFRD